MTLLGGALAGAAAVFLASPEPARRPEFNPPTINIGRMPEDERFVTPQKPLNIPNRYLDFDLEAVVEMAPDTELDLVFHKVEKWLPKQGEAVPDFHARFTVLRVSTRGAGRAMLTREQALFDDGLEGVRLVPGRSATITMEARGRLVRANVAGTDIPWMDTGDDHGNLAMVVRGHHVVVKRLKISPWGTPVVLLPVGWGAILGAAFGALLALAAGSGTGAGIRIGLGLLCWPAGGFLASSVLTGADFLVGRDPATWSVVAAGFCLLPASLLIAVRMGNRTARLILVLFLGPVLAAATLEWSARQMRDDLAAFQDPRLDLYFGPESGSAPFDALANRLPNELQIHQPPMRVEGQDPLRYDVLFLGGKLMFDQSPGQRDLSLSVVSQVAGKLGTQLGRPVDAAALPTLLPFAFQQYLMFERFYLNYAPRVVVFGVYDANDQPRLALPARQTEEALDTMRGKSVVAATDGGSVLLEIWRRQRQERVPPSGPGDLGRTLADVQRLCKSIDARLVLVLDKSLSSESAGEIRDFARTANVPLIQDFNLFDLQFPIEELVKTIRPGL